MGTPSSQNARPASHNYCTHRKKKLTEQTGRETYDLKKNEVHLNENIN